MSKYLNRKRKIIEKNIERFNSEKSKKESRRTIRKQEDVLINEILDARRLSFNFFKRHGYISDEMRDKNLRAETNYKEFINSKNATPEEILKRAENRIKASEEKERKGNRKLFKH